MAIVKKKCPKCWGEVQVDDRVAWKIGLAVSSGLMANNAKAHPLVSLLIAGATYWVAHQAIEKFNESCPECGELLQLVAALA